MIERTFFETFDLLTASKSTFHKSPAKQFSEIDSRKFRKSLAKQFLNVSFKYFLYLCKVEHYASKIIIF